MGDWRYGALGSVLAILAGCGNGESLEAFDGSTMGSTYSIKYVRSPGTPVAGLVQPEVERILAEVDRQMSTYRSDSDIERFNDLPANVCRPMPEPILHLVRIGEQLSQASGGAFDLTVEPLLNLWGFGPQARQVKVPDPMALAQARQRVGYQHLRIDGNQLCKDAAVQVDFNSIAAGYTVDRIAERLEQVGIQGYLVEVTGELKASGRKPDGTPWRVALEEPRDDQQVAERIIAVDGFGVSTSGDYRNYFQQDGRRYSHTLDARTGAPITHHLASVTVLDASALMADGLSTLLLVLGPEEGWDYAEKQGIAAFFVMREGDAFVTRSNKVFEQLTAIKP
ncbi:ApbE family lipoprotein [Pseudomonas fluorescens]|uniref:FAD:protein FMN transferase n=1 Tax=Pseudomonas fluorescens TaxID=294 RepID=A0A379IGQ1_PSEFL|nr:FAD:protein FMN transferase [Pseudomonas fluorescens]AIG02111.1 thiamine biosynthesis protein ApbE [Pseudomonas fluorescens]SUD32566.1 ApbE family lipoprotein [Pseudomonas fluorescens]